MDPIFQLIFLFALSFFLFLLLSCKVKAPMVGKKRMPAMAPGAWPLFGHLALYDDVKPTHYTLGAMADKYGPVFMTKLGSHNVVIISSQEVVKECYTVHDKCLDRTSLTASKLLGYNDAFMTFSPYGAYWREMRKVTTSEVFSATVIDTFKHRRAQEADVALRGLYKRWEQRGGPKSGVLVDMKQEFQDLTANISMMMVAGKRYFGESPNCESEEARRNGKNLVLSGSETSIAVLVWALSLLVNNPDALKKAHEELDRTIGKERLVEESDIKDLVYIQAIVKETFRLYPSVPLVAYRSVIEDFTILKGNYHIPAGTQLLVNAWKIGSDPSLWSDPERFEPERFLISNKNIDFSGQNYMLIAFGLGRRSCPAIHLGLRMVHFLLARFLQSFDVAKPSNQDVDMTQSNGMVNLKATPLEVFITPRLHQDLYYA